MPKYGTCIYYFRGMIEFRIKYLEIIISKLTPIIYIYQIKNPQTYIMNGDFLIFAINPKDPTLKRFSLLLHKKAHV